MKRKAPTKKEAWAGREHIAKLAREDGEEIFARQVLAGAWDHRGDVKAAMRGKRFKSHKAKKHAYPVFTHED